MATALDWMVSSRVFDAVEAHLRGLVHSSTILTTSSWPPMSWRADSSPSLPQSLSRSSEECCTDCAVMPHRSGPLASTHAWSRVWQPTPMLSRAVSSFLNKRDPQFRSRVPVDDPSWLPWSDERARHHPSRRGTDDHRMTTTDRSTEITCLGYSATRNESV